MTAIGSVASLAGLWDSDADPATGQQFSMRCLSPIVRTWLKAGALVALVLLFASAAEAARGPRRARERPTCDPATTKLRHLPRVPKTYGGPVAKLSERVLAGLVDPMTRMERVVLSDDQDDDEAIQNDAPAAHTDADERAMPVLTPIGLFIGPLDTRLSTRDCLPKSPRGPPLPA